jgi:hypothetical protein
MADGTVIVGNARLELLRGLAFYRDFHERMVREAGWESDFCRCVPLDEAENEYENDYADIRLAARECAAVGEIERHYADNYSVRLLFPDGVVAITDLGYARIKAHDAMGEAAQEPL